MQTHDSDQNDFTIAILNEGATLNEETLVRKNEDSVKYKLKRAACIFKEKLLKIGEKEAGKFVNYIVSFVLTSFKFVLKAGNKRGFFATSNF